MTQPFLAAFRPLAAASLLALAATTAPAATLTFSGTTDSGPLVGAAFSGSFSYADPVDAAFGGDIALDSFALLFEGQSLTLADATLPAVARFDAGLFLGIDFAGVGAGPWELSFTAGFFGLDEAFFSYAEASTGARGFGTPAFTAVPEPATLALAAGGLGLLAALRRRAATNRRA